MIGVIADDLTGAAELGGLARRLGMRAAVLLGGSLENQCGGSLEGEAAVVCIDTDSRSCSPDEAGVRAAEAARRLKEAGATWIYKKVDSVLRGQVVPEIEAIMEQLGYKLALLAPANPSLGRTICDGNYFVGGRPVHETEFARDPVYPRTTSNVLGLLGVSKFSICCGKLEEGLPGKGIMVAEAETSADVGRWAERCGGNMLMAGGAEFFGEIVKKVQSAECRAKRGESKVPSSKLQDPNKLQDPIEANREEDFKHQKELAVESSKSSSAREEVESLGSGAARELFVCGSTSESAREFAGEAVRSGGAAVFSLPEEIADGALFADSKVDSMANEVVKAFQNYQRVILQIGLPTVSKAILAARLALDLVTLAEAVLRRVRPAQVFAEGGATAVALARRLGWESFSVVRELAPGVVGLRPMGQERAPELIMKPGSYRWPEGVRKKTPYVVSYSEYEKIDKGND